MSTTANPTPRFADDPNPATPGGQPSGDAYYGDDAAEYRAVHTGALLGLLIAVVSLIFPATVSSFADVRQAFLLGIAPLVGVAVSAWSLAKIRANPELYTGAAAASAGLVIAGLSLAVGAAYGSYVYATEVPEGYTRTSFYELKPDEVELAAQEYIPPKIQELLGEKVFIKGYMRPDSTNDGLRKGVTEFSLVRDNAECCFGDKSKVLFFDQIAVKLTAGLAADLSMRVFSVGGVLTVRPGNPMQQEPPLVYMLEATHLK